VSQYDVNPRDEGYGDDPVRRGPRLKETRGTTVLVLGILGIVLSCVVLGIIAWVMGSGDLKEMREGTRERRQESETRIGMVLGIVSVVLTVLGILFVILVMAGVIGMGGGFFKQVQDEMEKQRTSRSYTEAEREIQTLSEAINRYKRTRGELPTSLDELLQTTDQHPEPVLRSLPRDPWHHEYRYELRGPSRYRLHSAGPDGQSATEDDVSRELTAPGGAPLPTER
jgi:hypothetical protein